MEAPSPRARIYLDLRDSPAKLERANKRTLRAWQLKEELRDITSMSLIAARRALNDWLS